MRKGIIRLTLGWIFLVLQLISLFGGSTANSSTIENLSGLSILAFFIGYLSPTICGLLLLFFGFRAYRSGDRVKVILHKNTRKAHTVTKYVFASILALESIFMVFTYISRGFYVDGILHIFCWILLIVYLLFHQGKIPSNLFTSTIIIFGATAICQSITVQLRNFFLLYDLISNDPAEILAFILAFVIKVGMGVVYILMGLLLYRESFRVSTIRALGRVVFALEILCSVIIPLFDGGTISIDALVLPTTIFVYTTIIRISALNKEEISI